MLAIDNTTITSTVVTSLTSNFMDAVAGTLPGVEREQGLLVTNEDIRKIKRYVSSGLALPTDEKQIEQLHKFNQLNITGLKSADMQILYTQMKEHAHTWADVESSMKAAGSDLHVFADNFTSSSESIISYLQSLPGYGSGTRKIEGLSPEEIDNLPEILLTGEEKQKIPALLALVEELKTVITQHSQSTQETKAKITKFKHDITNTIKPALDLKVSLCKSQGFSDDIKDLNASLDIITRRIGEKQSEIEQYSKSKWWGLLGGAVGFIVTSSIYGSKAQAARNELDRLTNERRDITKKIDKNYELLALLLTHETSLQDLLVRVEGASGSSSNLESLWELIQAYVDSSCKRLDGVTNAMYLISFVSRLKIMMDNWKAVKKQAGDLLTAFNNASSTY